MSGMIDFSCSGICKKVLQDPNVRYDTIGTIIGVALFIIGCLAAARKFPNPALGWTVVGLSSTFVILTLIRSIHIEGAIEKNKKQLLLTALVLGVVLTLGGLGGTHILTAKQVGQGILGIIGVLLLLYQGSLITKNVK